MTVALSPLAGAGAQFFDNNGVPLAGGLLYTYQAGTTTPLTTYSTSSGTIANSNPIVLDSSGRVPNEIWITNGQLLKIVIETSNSVVIGTYDNLNGINDFTNVISESLYTPGTNSELTGTTISLQTALDDITDKTLGSSRIGYNQGNTSAVSRTVQSKLQESVSVLDFGADPTGTTDSTAAFNNAFATGKQVYVPKGTYKCNATMSNKTIMFGDGSTVSTISPFNTSIAAITYTSEAPYWTYHSEVKDIGFVGTSQVGIGFTFGTTVPSNYTTGMEYANNVKFYGCRFIGLNKGVQFPFGNIGSEFYSCGFSGNYYGVYTLNNKFGGIMHAGNKYFYAGEFDGNICAVYINDTADGFGGIAFYSTIIEGNNIGIYCYTTSSGGQPLVFNDMWTEGNGAFVSSANVNIDLWTGTSVTTQSVAPHAYIFDGQNLSYVFNQGIVTDINLIATNSRILINDSYVETTTSFGGYPFICSDQQSQIILKNPRTDGGIESASRVFVEGNFKPNQPTISTGSSFQKVFLTNHRYNKLAGNYGGAGTVVNLTTAQTLGDGSFTVNGTTTSDGIIYGTCNNFVIPFTAANSQYVALTSAYVSITAGFWYVVTFDVKVLSGTPDFFSWDRNQNVLFSNMTIPETGVWYTVAAIGYCATNASIYALDVSSTTATTANINLSAFQIWQFATEYDAQSFLSSNVYVGP